MPRAYRRRYGGFRRTPTAPIASTNTVARRGGPCRGCGARYEKGDSIVWLRLKKSCRLLPCGHKLPGIRKFHPQCVPDPTQWNGLFGYDPTKAAYSAPTPSGGAIPPPPKPPTPEEAQLAAILSIQACVKARARGNPVWKKETDELFKRFGKLTALGLRPGTDAEGVAAIRAALTQAIKLVF